MAAKLSDLATGFRPEISCPDLRTSYTQSLSMGPSRGIYGAIGAAQINRRFTPILDTVTLFSFY
jgi:hypothetical protein